MTVDRDSYRLLAGSFPTGLAIVTARDADGSPKGLTTQSVVGLSSDPPLMLISIDKTSRTLAALQYSEKFVINFVKVGSEDLVTHFASKAADKFARVSWRPSAISSGAPILHETSIAYVECVVVRQLEVGDHWIFIGSVEGGEVLGGTPLLYYRRTYAPWPEEKPAPLVE
jgi:flavin reductase (DIM6/NTAB) family NADH-FMN oxidoreductase RutF